MFSKKIINIALFLCFGTFLLSSCAPFNSVDAKKFPPDPKLRVKKNMEEGRGFRLMDQVKKGLVEEILSLLAQMNYGEHHWML